MGSSVARLALFLENNLCQDRARDLLAGLGVIDDKVDLGLHHLGKMLERDVRRGRRIVEPPVGVFLDHNGRRFWALSDDA